MRFNGGILAKCQNLSSILPQFGGLDGGVTSTLPASFKKKCWEAAGLLFSSEIQAVLDLFTDCLVAVWRYDSPQKRRPGFPIPRWPWQPDHLHCPAMTWPQLPTFTALNQVYFQFPAKNARCRQCRLCNHLCLRLPPKTNIKWGGFHKRLNLQPSWPTMKIRASITIVMLRTTRVPLRKRNLTLFSVLGLGLKVCHLSFMTSLITLGKKRSLLLPKEAVYFSFLFRTTSAEVTKAL